jgi:hypothetical protein
VNSIFAPDIKAKKKEEEAKKQEGDKSLQQG